MQGCEMDLPLSDLCISHIQHIFSFQFQYFNELLTHSNDLHLKKKGGGAKSSRET